MGTPEPIRRFIKRLRAGEQLPVDDITITVDRPVTLTIEAPRDVPIGEVRRPDRG